MKRELYIFLAGLLGGILLSFYLYRKRKELKLRLNLLERKVKEVKLKTSIRNITSGLKTLIDKSKNVSLEEKEHILKKVEEKIRKLEEIV